MSIHQSYISTPYNQFYDPIGSENKPQITFHSSPAKYRVLRGGVMSGKTLAGIMETILTAIEYPNSEGVIGRWSYPELLRSTWIMFIKCCQAAGVLKKINNSNGNIYVDFHNGTRVWAVNLQKPENVISMNLGFWWVDECTEIKDPEVSRQLHSRLRHPVGPNKGWYTGTPGGQDWLKVMCDRDQSGQYHYIQTTAWDNERNLPPGTIDDLVRDMPLDWRQKYLAGEVDIYEGLVLPEFVAGHHVIPRFTPPGEWPRYRGIDHGWNHPTTCLWATADSEGNIYIYDSYSKSRSTIAQSVIDILDKTGDDHIEWTVIDPSTSQHTGQTGRTHIDEYRDSGITPIFGGNNRILDSVARIKQLMWVDPQRKVPSYLLQTGMYQQLEGCPSLYIMDHCQDLIEELRGWKWKEQKPGGVFHPTPVNQYDDSIAALRYIIMQNPRPAYAPSDRSDYERMINQMARYSEEIHRDDPNSDFAYSSERRNQISTKRLY